MFKKGDIVIISFVAAAILICTAVCFFPRPEGNTVVIKENNEVLYSAPLYEDRVFELSGNKVVIKNGEVFMESADCKDKICINSGKISELGESIICMPNRVKCERIMKKRIRLLCVMGILTALCIVLGFLERLVSLDFIAPGIRLGLANSLSLILIADKKPFHALGINIARILLSAMLFGSAVSLIFSLAGGLASWAVMLILSHFKSVSIIGLSVAGGVVHNVLQLLVAAILIGGSLFYYSPILLLAGAISGFLIGYISKLFYKKAKFLNF